MLLSIRLVVFVSVMVLVLFKVVALLMSTGGARLFLSIADGALLMMLLVALVVIGIKAVMLIVILEEEIPLVLNDIVQRGGDATYVRGLKGLSVVELRLLPLEAHSIVVQMSAHGMLQVQLVLVLVNFIVHGVEGEDLVLAVLLLSGTDLGSSLRIAVLNANQLLQRVVFFAFVDHLNTLQVLDHFEHLWLLRATLARATACQFSLAAWLA